MTGGVSSGHCTVLGDSWAGEWYKIQLKLIIQGFYSCKCANLLKFIYNPKSIFTFRDMHRTDKNQDVTNWEKEI